MGIIGYTMTDKQIYNIGRHRTWLWHMDLLETYQIILPVATNRIIEKIK